MFSIIPSSRPCVSAKEIKVDIPSFKLNAVFTAAFRQKQMTANNKIQELCFYSSLAGMLLSVKHFKTLSPVELSRTFCSNQCHQFHSATCQKPSLSFDLCRRHFHLPSFSVLSFFAAVTCSDLASACEYVLLLCQRNQKRYSSFSLAEIKGA